MSKIKIVRKWKDKSGRYQFGQDTTGQLYCRDLNEQVNLVLVDPYFKRREKFYYKFVNPNNNSVKLIQKNN